MKNKTIFPLLLLILAFAAGVFAKQPDPIARGIANYSAALDSKNIGLIESAMVNIIKVKLIYPQQDYSELISKLNRLTRSASDKAIRQEAFVVLCYLQYPERFNWIQDANHLQIDNLLTNMVDRFHQQNNWGE